MVSLSLTVLLYVELPSVQTSSSISWVAVVSKKIQGALIIQRQNYHELGLDSKSYHLFQLSRLQVTYSSSRNDELPKWSKFRVISI